MVAIRVCSLYVCKRRYMTSINIFVDVGIKLRLHARASAIVVECRVDLENKAISFSLVMNDSFDLQLLLLQPPMQPAFHTHLNAVLRQLMR